MPTLIPTIHLNGSSGEHLRDINSIAYRAVRAAIDALAEAAPNARDYYVQSGEAFQRAQDQHRERMDALTEVCRQLHEIREGIQDQLDARKQRTP